MFSKRKKHNRDISKQNWRTIVQYMRYKSYVKPVSAKGTTSTCPMCGGSMKLRKGQVVCKCGLTLDRQLCGAINIYLRMCFPQHPSVFFRSVARPLMRSMKRRMRYDMKVLGGVATNGSESDDTPPMNSRGGLSLMNSKAHIELSLSM